MLTGRMSRVLLGVVAIAAVLLPSVPAQAAPDAATLAVQREVAGLLRANPGSRQLDATSIEVDPGVVITVPSPARSATRGLPFICATGWLCLWQDEWYQGNRISFYFCNYFDLSQYHLSDGSPWNDRVTSVGNNQATSTALFWNWNSSKYPETWDLLFAQRPRSGTADLETSGRDNIIDRVKPC